jgi:Ca-activated chloride channel family protein
MSSFARKLSYLVLFLVLGAVVTIVGCENMRTDGGAPQERLARDAMPQATLRGLVESKRAEGERNDESDAPEDMFFERGETNPFVATEDDALSTFAADVDSGSYTLARSYLARGQLPPRQAPRVEEFVNAIEYDYPLPQGETFAIHMALAPSRYGQDIKNSALLRIGIQAKEIQAKNRKPAVLTFVIDTSGSMRRENRLGLVQRSLGLLLDELHEDDLVGIAAYGSEAHEILAHTHDKDAIRDALADLEANGSTNAEDGIRTGYKMAERVFRKGAINRVILCSDGVANVGATGPDAILATIVKQRRRGITLSALGVGMGNYNDHLLEQLGNKGDGHYAYIDTIAEARRVLVQNLTGTLQVVARDAKIQVQFDPKTVRSWRLLGYENRAIADEDFRNDKVDGGEIGAGHRVTALYELKLVPEAFAPEGLPPEAKGQVAEVTVRHKHDEQDEWLETRARLGLDGMNATWNQAPRSLRLAAAAAEFAEILRESYWAKDATLAPVLEDLRKIVGEGSDKDSLELASLVQKAAELRELAEASSTKRER